MTPPAVRGAVAFGPHPIETWMVAVMTTTLNPPRIRPKSFTYRTNVGEVQGRTATLSSEGKPRFGGQV